MPATIKNCRLRTGRAKIYSEDTDLIIGITGECFKQKLACRINELLILRPALADRPEGLTMAGQEEDHGVDRFLL